MTIELYKNSLISKEDASLYFEERYDSRKWFELTEENQEKLLISASRKINRFDFVGEKADAGQPMEFPRNYDMPQDIKDAVCEEAISMAQCAGSVHEENMKAGIKSISLGTGSISYGDSAVSEESRQLCSDSALYLVKKWVKKGYMFGC